MIIKFSCEILSLAFLQTLLWDYYMKSEQESCSRGEEITQSVLFLPCLVLPRSIRSSQSVTEYTHTHTHTRTHTRDHDAPPPHRPAHVCSSMSGEAERSFLLQLQLDLLQTFIPA